MVRHDDFGELKRICVHPNSRVQGLAYAILALLEADAREADYTLLKLETGPYQPKALAFYARSGYERCDRFAGYTNDPLSVFMQKRIAD